MKLSIVLVTLFLSVELFAQIAQNQGTPYAAGGTKHDLGIDVRSFFYWDDVELLYRVRVPKNNYIRSTIAFSGYSDNVEADLPISADLPKTYNRELNSRWSVGLITGYEIPFRINESVYFYCGPAASLYYSKIFSEDLTYSDNVANQLYIGSSTFQYGPALFAGMGFQVTEHLNLKIDNVISVMFSNMKTYVQENQYSYQTRGHLVGAKTWLTEKSIYFPNQNNFAVWLCYAF